jgi:hypothetical protein
VLKRVVLLAPVLAATSLLAQLGPADHVVVPEGVRYKEASAEVNRKAEDLLRKALSQNPPDFASLMPQDGKTITMTGKFISLYALKERQAELKGLLPAHYALPLGEGITEQSEGYVAHEPGQVAALAKVLSETIRLDPDFRIRKLTPEELAMVWYYIGGDIEEPIFVAEDTTHKLIFNFKPPGGDRLFWVEDLSYPCFKLGQPDGKALTPCFCEVAQGTGTRYQVGFRQCKEPADGGTPIAPYQDPVSGQTYNGDWRSYEPKGGVAAGGTLMNVVLLSSDETFRDNIEIDTLSAFVKRVQASVDAVAATQKESYGLIVEVTLNATEKGVFKMAVNYDGDRDRIQAPLETIYAGIAALDFPHTKSAPVKFQLVFEIGPAKSADKPQSKQ